MKLYGVAMVALLLAVTSSHSSPIEAQKEAEEISAFINTLSGALDQLETMEEEIEREAAEAPAGKLKDEKNLEAEFLQGVIQGMQTGGNEREKRGFFKNLLNVGKNFDKQLVGRFANGQFGGGHFGGGQFGGGQFGGGQFGSGQFGGGQFGGILG